MIKETKKVKVNWHGVEHEREVEVLRWPDERGNKWKFFMDIDICLYADCMGDHTICIHEDRAWTAITAGLLILCTGADYFEYTHYGPAGGNERLVIYDNDMANLLSIQQYLLDACGFGAESADDTQAQIYYNGNYIEK